MNPSLFREACLLLMLAAVTLALTSKRKCGCADKAE